MKLWLVRHAAPLLAPGLCYGRTDVPADADATAQCAARLRDQLPQHARLWSSPALRCWQLANALSSLRPDLRPLADPRLQELDFGAWELQPWDAIGESALCAWTADFGQHAPGGGEPVHALLARVELALADVRSSQHDAAWITHAGVIRAVHLLVQGITRVENAAQWPALAVPFGSSLELVLGDG